MQTKYFAAICNILSALMALAAAALWYKSTTVQVDEANGNMDVELIVGGKAFIATALTQVKWNRYAACAAAFAAFFQAMGILLNM